MKKILLALSFSLVLIGAGCGSEDGTKIPQPSRVTIAKPEPGAVFTQTKPYPVGGVITVEGTAPGKSYVTLFVGEDCIKTGDSRQLGAGRADDNGRFSVSITSVVQGSNTFRAMAASQEELEKIDPYACVDSQYISDFRAFTYEGPAPAPAKKR